MIDGKGTVVGWTAALTQAISLNPQVIVTSADVTTLQGLVGQANAKGIQVIGWKGAAMPGPDVSLGMASNVTTDGRDIGIAEAEYAIADSCGTAKVVIEYDSTYRYPVRKTLVGMVPTMQACKTCQILEVVNSPLSELETRQPQLCSSWVAKYGNKGWYGLTIYDGVWDFCIPALKSAGVGPTDVKLIGSDGTPSAYQRMAAGQYQVMSVPEPNEMEAYAIVDDAIRLMAGHSAVWGPDKTASQWTQPVFVAFSDGARGNNLSTEGGDKNQFYPTNDYVNKYLSMWGVQP
jgi:ribose transport system substrate-binding protein